MSPVMVLLIVLIVVLVLSSPPVGFHSVGWAPSGIVGAILVIVLILLLIGYL